MPDSFYRVFYHHGEARGRYEQGGPFYVPRVQQGGGRHDIPDDGIIYCSLEPLSALVEKLDKFKNQKISLDDLTRVDGSRMALAEFKVKNGNLLDCRLAETLEKLKVTSGVMASRERKVTQPISKSIYDMDMDGFIWNSAIDGKWSNASLFLSRVREKLELLNLEVLDLKQRAFLEAAEYWNITT